MRLITRVAEGVALLVVGATLSGCINRPGMKLACAWPPESARRLDLGNADDVAHLLSDIEIADELIVRYRDARGGRPPRQWLGIQVRSGGGGRPDPRVATECRARLRAALVAAHGITTTDIDALTPRLADRGWDLPVTIPVLLFYGLLVRRSVSALQIRFTDDNPLVRLTAIAVTSLAIAATVVLLGGLWAGLVEIIRLGNEHLSFRASRVAWPGRAPAWFAASMSGVWLAAGAAHFASRHGHKRTASVTTAAR